MDNAESVTSPEPKSAGGWLASNLMPLAFVAAAVALVVWRGLIVLDVALAVLGLGLVIFIHELGHFLAAKFCDVHVETFSIGFGKAIPGCQFRHGETTYKIGWIPLGGYVKMVGEGDNADTEEAYEDPRSFKNKAVWQRMVIISAGVVMNVILGCVCFMVAYSHGVDETSAIVGVVAAGSPAWQQDVRADSQVVRIDSIDRPTFEDIRPAVMSVEKGKAVPFQLADRVGNVRSVDLFPRRNPEDLYPMVGINPVEQLVLPKGRKGGPSPVRRNSPAFRAVGSDGSKLQGGDRIVASSHDPANPASVKLISIDSRDPSGAKLDAFEFVRNQYWLRGKPMTIQVDRDGTPVTFVFEPAWTQVLPNVRFQMGRLAALRANSPATRAVALGAAAEPALQVAKLDDTDSGDKIIAIEVTPRDGPRRRWVDEPSKDKEAGVEELPFDPLRLPHDLEVWSETANDLTVRVTVLRSATVESRTGRRATFDMQWDPKLVLNGEALIGSSAPMPISGLGLAYYVETTVDAIMGPSLLMKGDVITHIRFRDVNDKGETTTDKWLPIKHYQGVYYLHALLQRVPSPEIDFKVTRAGVEGVELTVTAQPDETWPAVDRGLILPYESQQLKANGLLDALDLGQHRTRRTVKVIYQTLYATIFREISTETFSGPLQIGNAAYKIAGYDLWQFILFIGLISVNLAVVNFLPIPLLDGGHMVFLLYEKIRGKPAPEKLIEWSLYGGLATILSLMAFVIFLDVRKLFF